MDQPSLSPVERIPVQQLQSVLVYERAADRRLGYRRVKRITEIVVSLLAIIILFPLFLLISLIIFLDDPKGGPIFVQKRCGLHGRLFDFYKFRSMCIDAELKLAELKDSNEMSGPAFKIKKDPRITRVGRFIRKTSIDELPQIFNVLKGDMSVVGPRPPLPREVERYDEIQLARLSVKPGLTCYWQIAPKRNSLTFDEWVRMDMKYIREQNLWVDMKIIFRTMKVMVAGEGE